MDPLGFASSLIAILQIAAKVTQFIKDAKQGATERTKLRDEMRNVVCLLEMIKDRVDDWDASDDDALRPASIKSLAAPDGPLSMFKATLEEIAAKLAPQDTLRRLARPVVWPFDKKEIDELLRRLERLKAYFNLVLQNDLVALAKTSNTLLCEIGKQVETLDTARRDDDAEKILTWISPISFRVKQADVFEGVEPGTGQWLLQHDTFLKWLEGEVDLLWCPGIPGAGKTKLASLIIDHLEQTVPSNGTRTFAYIYCEYQQRNSQTPLVLVSSLLEQVLRRGNFSPLPQELNTLYKLCTKHDTRPTLAQLTKLFRAVCSSYTTIHVVLDALDECADSDDSAPAFVAAVRALGPNIRLLCTSRFFTAFEGYFQDAQTLEITAHSDDIRTFLESRLQLEGSNRSRIAKHVRADPALKEEIIKAIVEESRGMFLLVALHFESLSRKISRKDVRSSLNTLPKTLDSTYDQAMERIRSQGEEDVEIAETLIFWILCAKRPLKLLEIQQMYATQALLDDDSDEPSLEDDDIPEGDILTGVCGGLVVVDSESRVCRLVHYTAQEYFQRNDQGRITTTKFAMSKISIMYLRLDNFSRGFAETDEEMADRLEKYPFLEYGGRYWGSDINNDDVADVMWPEIKKFLSNAIAVAVANQVWSLPQHRFGQWSQDVPRSVPALVLAASFDMPDILARLVFEEHNLEGKGTDGETPLIRAARLGLSENVSKLLQLGAVVNAIDVAGESALLRATESGQVAAMRVLVSGGADISLKMEGGWTILMSAVLSGNLEAVKILVEAGADSSLQTAWGDSALSIATWRGQEAIATYLADKGSVLPANPAGRRASLIAAKKGLTALVRRLTADYEAVARRGLHRQGARPQGELEMLAESDAEIPAADTENTGESELQSQNWGQALDGLDYTRGFLRRYDLAEQLGRGYSAELYACKNKVTGLTYSAKRFKFAGATRTTGESIWSEVEALKELRHENIVRMIEFCLSDTMDLAFLVLELVPGGELFNYIVANQKLSELSTYKIFQQLLSTLEWLHKNGWVHRDIKPENILLVSGQDSDLRIKLVDFGLCKKLVDGSGSGIKLTSTLCGTPSYVAPEVISLDSRQRLYGTGVDIWSAGVVLYICLCGFPPFSDELTSEKFPYTLSDQIRKGKFDYPSPYWNSVCDAAIDLIDSMLVVNSAKRFTASQCLAHVWMNPMHKATSDADIPCCEIVDRNFLPNPVAAQITEQGLTQEPEEVVEESVVAPGARVENSSQSLSKP
ncbi:hypothetical protein QBC38DRAFT_24376 [Podospora fimiseda]|uniref:Protein kinase domain-containing protein n=1 Tax=Podospora fimiseda TaxID=252190 RepID=A0AAN7GPZ6_9PEZI|nr:hypothetical protein QBC38DRAFT_24376 [Podospora fimiseda]